MNSASKIVAFVLAFFMLAYVGYQTYQFFYSPYETEIVLKEQYLEEIALDGFFVRDEMVFPEQKQGVIGYHYLNAEKVSKGASVASVYSQPNDLYSLREAEELQKLRDTIVGAQDAGALQGVKLDLLGKQIAESKAALIKSVDTDDFTAINDTYHALLSQMDRLNLYVDASVSYADTIAALDSRIAALKGGISETGADIFSPDSGYFSSDADGYEASFTPDMRKELTIESVQQAFSKQADPSVANAAGKLIRSSDWSFVALIPAQSAELLSEGQALSLKFSSATNREVPVTLTRLVMEKENKQAAVLLTGDYLDEDFVSMRFEKPRAVVKNYTGIIIPKEAVRIRRETDDEGNEIEVRGVYTMVGTAVRFKKIEAIYEDDFVIVSKIVSSSAYVAIYDEVVVKGKDLYAAAT